MANGGGATCGTCRWNPHNKFASDEDFRTDLGVCRLRKIETDLPFYTTCHSWGQRGGVPFGPVYRAEQQSYEVWIEAEDSAEMRESLLEILRSFADSKATEPLGLNKRLAICMREIKRLQMQEARPWLEALSALPHYAHDNLGNRVNQEPVSKQAADVLATLDQARQAKG